MTREEIELIGHSHGGGGHHGGGHRGGGFVGPWWGPYLDWDPDELYANPELSADEIDMILAERGRRAQERLAAKPAQVGDAPPRWAEESGFDLLGAETLTGEDWLNVFKGALSQVTGATDDKAKAEAKAKAATRWKWAAGIGAALGVIGLIVFGRKA